MNENLLYLILAIAYLIFRSYQGQKQRKAREKKIPSPSGSPRKPENQISSKRSDNTRKKNVDNVDKYTDLWTRVREQIEKELDDNLPVREKPESAEVLPERVPVTAESKKVVETVRPLRDYDDEAVAETASLISKKPVQEPTILLAAKVKTRKSPAFRAKVLGKKLRNTRSLQEVFLFNEILNRKSASF